MDWIGLMDENDERWEQARVIHATEHLLKRHHFRRILTDVDSAAWPALTPAQIHMIMTVHDGGSMTIKQLTQALRVKAPAVSAMVERLVEMGLLTREENPADRREVLVRVSPEEDRIIHEMERRQLGSSVELLERLGPEYARVWRELCVRIQAVLAEEQG
jgi:DNA-binding MarR family transcriptional regulator